MENFHFFEKEIPRRYVHLFLAIFVSIGLGLLEGSWTNLGDSHIDSWRTGPQLMMGCIGIFMAILPFISMGKRWLASVSIIESFVVLLLILTGPPNKPIETWGFIISSGLVIGVVLLLIRPKSIVNLHWVPLFAVIEEWAHIFSYGGFPWLGGRFLNHWTTTYTGIPLYPYLTFPVIFGIGEILLFIKSKKDWEIPEYIKW